MMTRSPAVSREPTREPVRVLFIAVASNQGDVAIGAATLEELRAVLPGAVFVTSTNRPEAYRALPAFQDDQIVPLVPLLDLNKLPPSGPGLLKLLKALFWFADVKLSGGKWLGTPEFREWIGRGYGNADLVVYQGGPNWNREWITPRRLAENLLQYELAARLGAAIVLYTQSFGPFDWPTREGRLLKRLSRYALGKVTLITTRDAFSVRNLLGLGIPADRIVESADAAINLSPAPPETGKDLLRAHGVTGSGRPLIGLTVRDLKNPEYGFTAREERGYRREMAGLVDTLVQEHGEVCFLSTDFSASESPRSDLAVLRDIQSMMKHGSALHVVDRTVPPHILKAAYAHFDFLISTRLHPLIFAVTQGVPSISVGYAAKCRALMDQLGMSDYHISARDFTEREALKLFLAMRSEGAPLKNRMLRRVDELSDQASSSSRAVERLLRLRRRPLLGHR